MSISSLDLAKDTEFVENFTEVHLANVPDDGYAVRPNRERRIKLFAKLLHCKRADASGLFRFTKANDKKYGPRVPTETPYDRWLLMMEISTSTTFVIISRDPSSTSVLLHYNECITLGGLVALL